MRTSCATSVRMCCFKPSRVHSSTTSGPASIALCRLERSICRLAAKLLSSVYFARGITAGKLACRPRVIFLTVAGASELGAKKAGSILNWPGHQSRVAEQHKHSLGPQHQARLRLEAAGRHGGKGAPSGARASDRGDAQKSSRCMLPFPVCITEQPFERTQHLHQVCEVRRACTHASAGAQACNLQGRHMRTAHHATARLRRCELLLSHLKQAARASALAHVETAVSSLHRFKLCSACTWSCKQGSAAITSCGRNESAYDPYLGVVHAQHSLQRIDIGLRDCQCPP